jgi:hypothetical protein
MKLELKHLGKIFTATIKLRSTPELELKEEIKPCDGKRLRFIFMGACDDHRYPNEWLFMPVKGQDLPVTWIASGDLKDIVLETE